MIFIPSASKSHKLLKMEAMLQRLVANEIHRTMPDLYSKAQISRVKVSKCRRYLDLYMTGSDKSAIAGLQAGSWRLKKALRAAELRVVPQLRFHHDSVLANEILLDELLGSMAEQPSPK